MLSTNHHVEISQVASATTMMLVRITANVFSSAASAFAFFEVEYETHDDYWNSAQKQMVVTGKMHGYMRMYWGKKIIEWTKTPQEAYEVALYLNNKYELDGRDPNGYAGVAWCFGKHDRPWKERGIFGKIRYMNGNGLRRKFKIDNYGHCFYRQFYSLAAGQIY